MKSSGLPEPAGALYKSVLIAAALLVAAVCLQIIVYLNSKHTTDTQNEAIARNRSASALYVKLATLGKPTTISSITRTAHLFVRQEDTVNGITLVDAEERLIAHLGNGNDALLNNPSGSPTARIPIDTDGQLHGYAIVAFHTSRGTIDAALHYFTLAAVSVMLAMVSFALLHQLARNIISLARQASTAATIKKHS